MITFFFKKIKRFPNVARILNLFPFGDAQNVVILVVLVAVQCISILSSPPVNDELEKCPWRKIIAHLKSCKLIMKFMSAESLGRDSKGDIYAISIQIQ